MPIVIVEMWPIPGEKKAGLMRRITDAFTEGGIPSEAVNIVIHESPKDNWATGGEQHSVKYR